MSRVTLIRWTYLCSWTTRLIIMRPSLINISDPSIQLQPQHSTWTNIHSIERENPIFVHSSPIIYNVNGLKHYLLDTTRWWPLGYTTKDLYLLSFTLAPLPLIPHWFNGMHVWVNYPQCMKIKGSNIDGECRFGCGKIEDMHHVFVECRRFKDMRKETADGILKATADIISKFSLKEATVECLLTKAKSSFVDCAETWPLQYSAFYLGHIPHIDNIVDTSAFENRVTEWRFFHTIHCTWHAAS